MSTDLEIMPDTTEKLALVVQQNALAPETAASLQGSFAPIYREARSVLEKSRGITVTDASQKLEIKLARECRLALAKIRINGDKLKKSLKEESSRYNKACDGFYNILLHLTADEEARLEEQEKFVARQEAARKAQLSASRQAALAPFGLDTSFMQLGEMPDETFAQLLENTRAGHEAKLARERKEQEDRIRAENERLREEARIREENAKLQREAKEREEAARLAREQAAREKDEAEAALAAEREAAEAREKAQREAAEATLRAERERLEAIAAAERQKAAKAAEEAAAKAKAQREADQKRAAEVQRMAEDGARKERLRLQALAEVERQKAAAAEVERARLAAEAEAREKAELVKRAEEREAARKAALAPDREKLLAVAQALRALDVPQVSSEAAKDVVAELLPRLTKLAVWLETEASRL